MQESAVAAPTTASVMTHKPHKLPFYTVPDNALQMGASLGNSAVWINTKSTGAVERVFNIAAGESLVNTIAIGYAGCGDHPFAGAVTASSGEQPAAPSYVGLHPSEPGTFEIHPAYQRHRFSLAGSIPVSE